jgi:hypothetical protein
MTEDERFETLRINIESLHSNVHELWEASQRHDAAITRLLALAEQDGVNIRGLARIAEIHERRLTALEGDLDEEQ